MKRNDASLFEGELAHAKDRISAMERFSPVYSFRESTTRYSDPKSPYGKYKFISLMDACHDIRLEPPLGYRWHRAFPDAEMLRRVWAWMEQCDRDLRQRKMAIATH